MGGLQQGRGGWRGEGNPPRGSGAEAGAQDRFQARLWFARGHTLTRARRICAELLSPPRAHHVRAAGDPTDSDATAQLAAIEIAVSPRRGLASTKHP